MQRGLDAGICTYCGKKLTLANLAADHKLPINRGGDFSIPNTCICCKSCNWQKGSLNALEFRRLNQFLIDAVDAEAAAQLRRRLSAGGRILKQ